ncbi:hypothetical protein LUZ62_071011 [Rhynchospora pubera]|uniref:Neprosin PEP catalytic domain-containing protein n=1 Tax=Rhynchospora pubera TaxID=906938 RepID=A0AAV8D038_9POAL|nr:hypothetical protein LUZ62_071011 [Rhynchospora pubera]
MDIKMSCFGTVVLCFTILTIGVQARELRGLSSVQPASNVPLGTSYSDSDGIVETRAAYFTTNHDFTGFIASLTVHNHDIKKGQMTNSYISIQSNANEEISAGWVVDPWKYGDSRTRFFTYWRGFKCPNSECHNEFVPKEGSYLAPGYILDSGNHLTIKLLKDANTGDWKLFVGPSAAYLSEIGYYPKSLFTQLAVQANHAEFGGSVQFLDYMTGPPMGNGVIAEDNIPPGKPTPAMMTDVYYVRPDGKFDSIKTYTYKIGKINCYSLGKSTVNDLDRFAYGGVAGCNRA